MKEHREATDETHGPELSLIPAEGQSPPVAFPTGVGRRARVPRADADKMRGSEVAT
ncbi:Hypothetical protein A7982_08653 [Minicystis rosea]|nr:Hypothetical protein A7982_08653 [Minicystis rosea]